MYQLMFSTVHCARNPAQFWRNSSEPRRALFQVHGLYRERYAYRDYMTDVVVQHMVTEQVRTRTRLAHTRPAWRLPHAQPRNSPPAHPAPPAAQTARIRCKGYVKKLSLIHISEPTRPY